MLLSRRSIGIWSASALLAAALVTSAASAAAQIKEPGQHLAYSVELEPHLLMQFDRTWLARGVGYGAGFRATIPILQNGPLPKLNNSLGIGAGLDWSVFNDCDGKAQSVDCSVNQIWVPVVAQWNFFFTPIVSVFAELGASVTHRKLDYPRPGCPFITDGECQASNLAWFQPVLFVGGRFSFSKTAGLLLRLGTPYLSIGADFTL